MKNLNLTREDITWAPIIPLIGGFPLGAELAIGHAPEFVASYSGFWANDQHYMNYMNNTLGRNIDYINLTENDKFSQKVNIVVSTPPCAALSRLNTGKTPEVKGSDSAKNEWMYQVVYDGVNRCDADAIIIENAPTLFTNTGTGVAKRLEEIANEFGRSISFYKTSTHYHGIPQVRDRTFAIVWKMDTAPVLNWYKRPCKNFEEYLKEVPQDSIQQDIIINPKIANESFYNFVKHKTGNDNAREEIYKSGKKTAFKWVEKYNLLDEAIQWFSDVGDDKGLRLAEHAKYKFSIGKDVWDGSTLITTEHTRAWIGRNMRDAIHPTEDRSYTIRESLHIMGFPHEFELLGGRKNSNAIGQTVPLTTSADMVEEAIQALLGNRESSGLKMFKQNNHTEVYVTPIKEEVIELI